MECRGYIFLHLLIIGVALVLFACAGSNTTSADLPVNDDPIVGNSTIDVLTALPVPSVLKSATATEPGYFLHASAFQAGWPNYRVQVSPWHGETAFLRPNSADKCPVAYAIYEFNVAGLELDGALRIRVSCGGDIWLGLADFSNNCWQWHCAEYPQANPATRAVVVKPATNIHDSLLPVLVLVFDDAADVEWLSLHGQIPPVITSVEVYDNIEAHLGSCQVDITQGLPNLITWNFGIAGYPNHSFEREPALIFGAPGLYQCSVTASNGAGSSEYPFELEVLAIPEGAQPVITAVPLDSTIAVGEEVTIVVSTSTFPAEAKMGFQNGVSVVFPSSAAYVSNSFNLGSAGGEAYDTDGFWATLDPCPNSYLQIDEALLTPYSISIPELHAYLFNITPVKGGISDQGGNLFSFRLRFSEPGVFPIRFLGHLNGYKQTFYSSDSAAEFYWADYSNQSVAHTVTVTD